MINELNGAINSYIQKWQTLVATRTNKQFFTGLRPTSAGWKTQDLADFNARYNELRDLSDQIHLGWINERWLATFHLKNAKLPLGLSVIKLMQRRPGSPDAVGLDHLDFYLPAGSDAKAVVSAEPDLKWSEEKNGNNCKWLSVWFSGTEAKLRSDTVLEVCAAEMKDVEKVILNQ